MLPYSICITTLQPYSHWINTECLTFNNVNWKSKPFVKWLLDIHRIKEKEMVDFGLSEIHKRQKIICNIQMILLVTHYSSTQWTVNITCHWRQIDEWMHKIRIISFECFVIIKANGRINIIICWRMQNWSSTTLSQWNVRKNSKLKRHVLIWLHMQTIRMKTSKLHIFLMQFSYSHFIVKPMVSPSFGTTCLSFQSSANTIDRKIISHRFAVTKTIRQIRLCKKNVARDRWSVFTFHFFHFVVVIQTIVQPLYRIMQPLIDLLSDPDPFKLSRSCGKYH